MFKLPVFLVCGMFLFSACGIFTPDAQIETFTVSPSPVDRGGTLTITWATRHAAQITLRDMLYDTNFGDPWLVASTPTYSDLPAQGSMTVTVPDNFRRDLRFALEVTNADGETTLLRSEVIPVQNYPCWHDSAQSCTAPPESHPVTVAMYEQGFTLRQEDSGETYIIRTALPGWSRVDANPPDENALIDELGAPTGEIYEYEAQWSQHLDVPREAVFDYGYIAWHDGCVLTLIGQFTAESGPSWQLSGEGQE